MMIVEVEVTETYFSCECDKCGEMIVEALPDYGEVAFKAEIYEDLGSTHLCMICKSQDDQARESI